MEAGMDDIAPQDWLALLAHEAAYVAIEVVPDSTGRNIEEACVKAADGSNLAVSTSAGDRRARLIMPPSAFDDLLKASMLQPDEQGPDLYRLTPQGLDRGLARAAATSSQAS
jgi:hypothetical protein